MEYLNTSFVDILQHLNGNSIVNDTNYTHVTLFDPEKKWSIPDLEVSKFWQNYCGIVYNDSETVYVAEKNINVMPTVFDFKYKYYSDTESTEPYNEETSKYIIASAQEAICELFHTSDSYEELYCCLLSSETTWEESSNDNEYIVTKMRLHFPYCRIQASTFNVLRAKLIRTLHKNQVLAKFQERPLGDWDTIIDKDTITKPLLMYGSVNNSDESKLILEKIYGSIEIDEFGDIEQAEELYLSNVFNRKHHSDFQRGLVPSEMLDRHELDFWVPMLLSVNYPLTIVRAKGKDEVNPNTVRKENDYISETLKTASDLLKIISAKKFQDQIYNKEIGKALYYAADGDSDGLDLWISSAQRAFRAAKMGECEIEDRIEKMRSDYYLYTDTPITERTLAWFAKEDNIERYNSWHREWCAKAFDNSLSGSHADVAEALYRYKWLEHICVDPAGPVWYEFHKNRMIKDSKGIGLKSCISRGFVKIYEQMRLELVTRSFQLDEGSEKDKIEDKIKCIISLIKNLKDEPYKSSIMRAAQESFRRKDFDFYTALDSNMELMGLPNGVLEVYENRCIVRQGKPEDFITLRTGVPYREDFHWDHIIVKKYLKWMSCVHRDPLLCKEWRKLTSSMLHGGNNDKVFPIPTGESSGGKSQVVKGWETAFGQYCFNYPVELLSSKNRNPQGATPATARGRGRHIAITTEPDDDDPLKKGLIKGISGGDRFFGRMLHDNGSDIAASFVMTLWCNDIPIFPTADDALKDRVIIYPFLSVWKDKVESTPEEQFKTGIFKKDKFFDKQIPQLAQGLLWVAVQDYPMYKEEGLIIVPAMTEAINKYWSESDVYYQYTCENILEVKDENDEPNDKFSKTVTEVYLNFGKWFRQCFPGSQPPDRRVFKKEISKRWNAPVKSRWFGIAFTEEDTSESGGAYDFAGD